MKGVLKSIQEDKQGEAVGIQMKNNRNRDVNLNVNANNLKNQDRLEFFKLICYSG